MIEITSLTKKFSGLTAVDSLSLVVPDGTLFGLVGPNGAGKSTLINMMTGIIAPTSGTVSINGIDCVRQSVDYKRMIGVVPETSALFEGLTGEEQLMFIARVFDIPASEARRRIDDLLTVFELTDAATRLSGTYSQGMKKKLAFASAIIHQPHTLFLDEPFENVDPISRSVMKGMLSKIIQRGGTIVFTSHSLEMVEALCDTAAIIHQGKIVFQSRTGEIRSGIKNAVTSETYGSLEEIFIDLTTHHEVGRGAESLTWM